VLDTQCGEECDDGNTADGDGCSATCKRPSTLGGSASNPATSCLHIRQAGAARGDHAYWIALPSGVVQMNCNFSLASGGWTRVGALDGSQDYCTPSPATDLRSAPNAGAGKIPDDDARALMTGTPGSPKEVLYVIRDANHPDWFAWHALEHVDDFTTLARHASSPFYCTTWHCGAGFDDASSCGSEGDGCPITAHGDSGGSKKIYVDFESAPHQRAFHSNGGMCGLSDPTAAPIWVYVR
jgi:cysteine-rich repeat protein